MGIVLIIFCAWIVWILIKSFSKGKYPEKYPLDKVFKAIGEEVAIQISAQCGQGPLTNQQALFLALCGATQYQAMSCVNGRIPPFDKIEKKQASDTVYKAYFFCGVFQLFTLLKRLKNRFDNDATKIEAYLGTSEERVVLLFSQFLSQVGIFHPPISLCLENMEEISSMCERDGTDFWLAVAVQYGTLISGGKVDFHEELTKTDDFRAPIIFSFCMTDIMMNSIVIFDQIMENSEVQLPSLKKVA